MVNYMQQQNFDEEDAEQSPPIFEEDVPEPTSDPIPKPTPPVEWYKNPVVWVAVISLLIAIVALIMYMRNKKIDF